MNIVQSALLFLGDHPWLFALAKGSLMLGVVGGVFAVALKLRLSAAARHGLLLAGCMAALVVPLLALAPAAWRVAVPVAVEAQVEAAMPKPQAMPAFQPKPQAEPMPEVLPVPSSAQVAPAVTAWHLPPAAQLALWLWLLGAAVVLMPLAVAYLRLLVQVARARTQVRPQWRAWLAEEAAHAGVRHRVGLCVLPTTGLAPATFGFGRFSRIVLPIEAHDWPEHDLRLVLAHELAHVRRCDWLARLAGQLMLAVYWFNPLAWWAVWRMGAEAEFACDERVVAGGARASDYAQCMVDMAARMRGAGGGCMAPAMPFGSFLSRRIVMVLETNNERGRLGRVWAVALVICAVGGAVGVGCTGVGRKAQVAHKERKFMPVEDVVAPEDSEIVKAVKAGDVEKVKRLLAVEKMSARDIDKAQLLHMAASEDRVEVAKVLLAAGARLDIKDWYRKEPPLFYAQSAEMVRLLLASGAKFSEADHRDDTGRQPLQNAAACGKIELIKALLAAGAKVDAVAEDGSSPMDEAIFRNEDELIKVLRDAGAKTTIKDRFLLAVENGRMAEAKQLLAQGVDMEASAAEGAQAIHLAIRAGDVEMVKFLLLAGAKVEAVMKDGEHPLHLAAQGQAAMVQCLLSAGAKVDVRDRMGFTPFYNAIASEKKENIKLLAAAGADVNVENKQWQIMAGPTGNNTNESVGSGEMVYSVGLRPIHTVAQNGNLELIKLLIAAGAKLDVPGNDQGSCPIHLAAANGHMEVVKALLVAGVKANSKDKAGNLPSYWAKQGGHQELAKYLAEQEAKERANLQALPPAEQLFIAAKSGDLEIVKRLLASGVKPDEPTKDGELALWGAAYNGRTEVVKALLAAGAKVDSATQKDLAELHMDLDAHVGSPVNAGDQAIHFAAMNDQMEVVKLLLASGAKADAVNKFGVQPIQGAIYAGDIEMVRLLLASGAKPDAADTGGYQPIHAAAVYGRVEISKLLLAAGAKADAKTKRDGQPIHLAAKGISTGAKGDHVAVIKLLLAAGAKVDAVTKEGAQPIHMAVAYPAHANCLEIVRCLVDAGAKVTIKGGDWESAASRVTEANINQFFPEGEPKDQAAVEKYHALCAYLTAQAAKERQTPTP